MRTTTRTPERAPSTLELLDREEERTWVALERSLRSAGEHLLPLGEVRELARRRPGLALAASATAGALLAPLLGRAARAALPVLLKRWSRRPPRSLSEP